MTLCQLEGPSRKNSLNVPEGWCCFKPIFLERESEDDEEGGRTGTNEESTAWAGPGAGGGGCAGQVPSAGPRCSAEVLPPYLSEFPVPI